MTQPLRIGILGPGAVGGFVGGALAHARHDILLLTGQSRSVTPAEITVSSARLGEFRARVTVVASLPDPVDVLFVTVKSPSLAEALRTLDPAMVAGGLVVPLMNGIDHLAMIRSRVGQAVVAGTIRVEAERAAPGFYRQLSPFADIRLGPTERASALRTRLQAAVVAAGLSCETTEDELTLMWTKLALLAPLALATAATGWPIGDVVRNPAWRERLLAACDETCAVAAADGASIRAEAVRAALLALPATMRSSLQRDVDAGRPTELDAIGGAVVRHGRSVGVPTPGVESLVAAVERRVTVLSAIGP